MSTTKRSIATPRVMTEAELTAELLDAGNSGVRVWLSITIAGTENGLIVDHEDCGDFEVVSIHCGKEVGRVTIGARHMDGLITALQTVRDRVVLQPAAMVDVMDAPPLAAGGVS